jgi:DNA-binding transcriptional MerR regulator
VNQTKNQHFLSQVEQRLNACNPNADATNQRIYEFEIVDRDEHILRLTNAKGRAIQNNLSMLDLFSFDVDKDADIRFNFEQAFERYEGEMRACTERLLRAHATGSSDVADDVFSLFVAKLLNFARNPFSVAKVINTFGTLGQNNSDGGICVD